MKKKKSKRKKNSKKKSIIFKSICVLILATILCFLLYFIYMINLNGGGLKGVLAATLGHTPFKLQNLKPINILVVGANDDNTDTIILCSYNPKTQEASMLSIPRDTYIGRNVQEGKTTEKINAVYLYSGVEALVREVEDLTDLDIPYYLVLSTENIANVVDLVGGVEFDVPIDMNYYDPTQDLYINLKKGKQLIDGEKAEMLVRFRHNSDGTTYPAEYGYEDIGRTKTQRNFIKALAKHTISNFKINQIYELISQADKYVETNLKLNDYKDYVPYAVEFNPDDIKSTKLSGSDVMTTYSFFVLDQYKLEQTIFDLFVFSDDERKQELGDGFEIKTKLDGDPSL